MVELDSRQRVALEFYYNEFRNWPRYDEIEQQRSARKHRLVELLSRDSIDNLTEEQVVEVLNSLWAGSLFPKQIIRKNPISKIRKTFKYLLYDDKDDPFVRCEKIIKDPEYRLESFGESRISELLIKVRPELSISLVNSRIKNLASRLGCKLTYNEDSFSEELKTYDEFVKKIHTMFSFKNLDELDYFIYFIDYFPEWFPDKKESLPRFENGEFMFSEDDFSSTTGKEEDSKYLYSRFKILKDSLSKSLPPSFVNDLSYVGRVWNQGSKTWNDYDWIGFIPNGDSKKKYDEIQFQVSIHKDLKIGIWVDAIAKTKIKSVQSRISENEKEFLNLIRSLPTDCFIGVEGSSGAWEKQEYSTRTVSETDLNHVLELLDLQRAEFSIRQKLTKEETLNLGIEVNAKIKETFTRLVPVYEFLEGRAVDFERYFILISYPDSEYTDIEGKQYEYDSNKPNYTKLLPGSRIILQGKLDNKVVFLGNGVVKSIQKSKGEKAGKSIDKFVAYLEHYEKFEPTKLRTETIYEQMKTIKEFGNQQPSILPISLSLFEAILEKSESKPPSEEFQRYERILLEKKQLIFYGPPGTGKTREALRLARNFVFERISDDQFNAAVMDIIMQYAKQHGYSVIKEETSDNLYTLQNSKRSIRLGMHFSGSDKKYPESPYIGVPQKMINFLKEVPEQDRFEIIVNNDTRNFLVLPYVIKQKFARFSGGQWDQTGEGEHSFHVNITKDSARIPVRDNTHYEKEYDLTANLNNLDTLRLSGDARPFGYVRTIIFHQSYSYEEFVEGIKAKVNDSNHLVYEIEDGVFKTICKDAERQPERNFVLIIDEINRGNISKIFGELISLIENDKRAKLFVNLAYSKERFTVPNNVYIIGTMNTADRSLVQIDIALRRRFGFVELMPKPDLLGGAEGVSLSQLLVSLNRRIIINGGNREQQIGHSYFMKDGKSISTISDLKFIFETEVIPLLQEYFFEDYHELERILGPMFIDLANLTIKNLTTEEFRQGLEYILKNEPTTNS